MAKRKRKIQDLSLEQALFEEIMAANQTKTEQILAKISQEKRKPSHDVRKNPAEYLNYLQGRRKLLTKVSLQPHAEANPKEPERVKVDIRKLKNNSSSSLALTQFRKAKNTERILDNET